MKMSTCPLKFTYDNWFQPSLCSGLRTLLTKKNNPFPIGKKVIIFEENDKHPYMVFEDKKTRDNALLVLKVDKSSKDLKENFFKLFHVLEKIGIFILPAFDSLGAIVFYGVRIDVQAQYAVPSGILTVLKGVDDDVRNAIKKLLNTLMIDKQELKDRFKKPSYTDLATPCSLQAVNTKQSSYDNGKYIKHAVTLQPCTTSPFANNRIINSSSSHGPPISTNTVLFGHNKVRLPSIHELMHDNVVLEIKDLTRDIYEILQNMNDQIPGYSKGVKLGNKLNQLKCTVKEYHFTDEYEISEVTSPNGGSYYMYFTVQIEKIKVKEGEEQDKEILQYSGKIIPMLTKFEKTLSGILPKRCKEEC
jgi:hypothetical protein